MLGALRNIIVIIMLGTPILTAFGQDTTAFRKEIPTWGDNQPDLFYSLTTQKAKQLKLEDIHSGFDSLQIRVWYGYSTSRLRELIVLKKDNKGWSGSHHTMKVEWDPVKLTDTVKKHDRQQLEPKSDWASLIQKLLDNQILTLPDMDDIKGIWYEVIPETGDTMIMSVADGITYNFEIATNSYYRFYSYGNPKYYQANHWQARNILAIMDILKSEFRAGGKKGKARTHNTSHQNRGAN
jgi:hypothetical protein